MPGRHAPAAVEGAMASRAVRAFAGRQRAREWSSWRSSDRCGQRRRSAHVGLCPPILSSTPARTLSQTRESPRSHGNGARDRGRGVVSGAATVSGKREA